MNPRRTAVHGALHITIIYLVFSLLWIFLSDRILLAFTDDINLIALISNLKGFFFVSISALIIFMLVSRKIAEKNEIIAALDREVDVRAELIRELHHRIKNNLQVVISLVNLESASHREREAFINALNEKLQSMMAVFNVVYNYNDMRNIALDRVLHSYAKTSPRRLTLLPPQAQPSLSVEAITSLMLVLDSVLSTWFDVSVCPDGAAICLCSDTAIELRCKRQGPFTACSDCDQDFINLELAAINGSLEINPDEGVIRILFTAM